MDKESIIELQKIDCNCNDCVFIQRDIEKFKASQELHHKWQLDYFNLFKQKLIDKAKWYKDTYYDLEMWDKLLTESDKMKFQFNSKTAMINYGNCTKLNKQVSFIPNNCQLETQSCFKHRRDGV
jgi:hypothetical protein